MFEGTISDIATEVINLSTISQHHDAGVWNYQILLLVHGQVNGQNPLVQPRFTCPKILIFFLFLKENIFCGYSLEAPHWGASNEYPQHMFYLRN